MKNQQPRFAVQFRISFAAIAFLFLSTVAFAQFDSATVLGTIRDSSGAVIDSAKVTLKNVNTGIAAVSEANNQGNFQFLNVPIGT